MRFFYATALIGLATLTLFSCSKDTKELENPQPLLLKPLYNESRLSDQVLDKVSMYYYMTTLSTQKKYVTDFGRSADAGYQQGILYSLDVAALSGAENHKTFYLEFPDGVVDTIDVDYGFLSDAEAKTDPCFCRHPQKSVRINHREAYIIDYDVNNTPIYVVPK